jgi:cytochrome oxidase assembly protein ShyY1
MSRHGARRRTAPFWLRPKWLLGHVLVVVLVALFVLAGLWQLRRHDDRQSRNAEIRSRAGLPTAPVGEVVPEGAGLDDVDSLEFRPVEANGTYDAEAEVFVRPRSLDGLPGWHVVTPLVLDDGRAVLVTRGFAPYSGGLDGARENGAPPTGEVVVTGLAFPTQEREGIGPTDPAEGTLEELARVDIARVAQQYDRELLPVYVQLQSQDPPQPAGFPQLVPPPETDDGPHFSYAVQWFLFAGVGLVGWPVLLWRTGREEAHDRGRPPAGGPPTGDGDGEGDGDGDGDGGGGGGSRPPTPDRPRKPVGAGVG